MFAVTLSSFFAETLPTAKVLDLSDMVEILIWGIWNPPWMWPDLTTPLCFSRGTVTDREITDWRSLQLLRWTVEHRQKNLQKELEDAPNRLAIAFGDEKLQLWFGSVFECPQPSRQAVPPVDWAIAGGAPYIWGWCLHRDNSSTFSLLLAFPKRWRWKLGS